MVNRYMDAVRSRQQGMRSGDLTSNGVDSEHDGALVVRRVRFADGLGIGSSGSDDSQSMADIGARQYKNSYGHASIPWIGRGMFPTSYTSSPQPLTRPAHGSLVQGKVTDTHVYADIGPDKDQNGVPDWAQSSHDPQGPPINGVDLGPGGRLQFEVDEDDVSNRGFYGRVQWYVTPLLLIAACLLLSSVLTGYGDTGCVSHDKQSRMLCDVAIRPRVQDRLSWAQLLCASIIFLLMRLRASSYLDHAMRISVWVLYLISAYNHYINSVVVVAVFNADEEGLAASNWYNNPWYMFHTWIYPLILFAITLEWLFQM